MIPEQFDIDAVVGELAQRDVYIDAEIQEAMNSYAELNPGAADAEQVFLDAEQHLQHLAADPHLAGLGETKIVILGPVEATEPDLRDIAQYIKDATKANTVVVEAPHAKAVVADNVSRFAIERNKKEMGEFTDVNSTAAYLATVGNETTYNTVVSASSLTIIAIAVLIAAAFARKSVRTLH